MYRIDKLNLEGKKNIIIQFPSNQLKQAQQIWLDLNKTYPDKRFIISSDPLHSSCCVNLVGAMHVLHDLIIHFGEACFSEPVSNMIQYVLPYIDYDANKLIQELETIDEQNCVLFDQAYDHILFNTKHIILQHQNHQQKQIACGYYAPMMLNQLIFIGSSESELLQRFISHFDYGVIQKCLIIDPITLEKQIYQVNQMPQIMKRSKQVEEAQECNCFGILINNPTAEYTKNALNLCKTILKQNNKKWFVFSMNSLNESKLGNFPEIDAYIIISCYRNSIIDTKKYYKLIITPFQLIQAFSKVEYKIESDLHLVGQQVQEEVLQEQNNENNALLSVNNNGQLIPLDKIFQSLDFYKGRTYQGLEIKNDLQPAKLEIGLTGIASHYEKEGEK